MATSGRTNQERSTETRERILSSARLVFSEKGVLGASITDIERQSQLPRALIYYHFGSVDHIITTITQQNLGQVRDRIKARILAANDQTSLPSIALRDLVLDLLKLVDEITIGPGRPMSIHVWSAALVNEEIRGVVTSMFAGIQDDLSGSLALRDRVLDGDAMLRRSVAVSLFSLIIPAFIVQRLFSGEHALEPATFLSSYERLFKALGH